MEHRKRNKSSLRNELILNVVQRMKMPCSISLIRNAQSGYTTLKHRKAEEYPSGNSSDKPSYLYGAERSKIGGASKLEGTCNRRKATVEASANKMKA